MQDNITDMESGYVPGTAFASADFPDADGAAPTNSLTSTVTSVSLYHLNDINEKNQQAKAWRKKVRDIIQSHQELIIDFLMQKPLPEHHVVKFANHILTKYGKVLTPGSNPSGFDTSKASLIYLKDFIVDSKTSGIDDLNTYIKTLEEYKASDTPLQRWTYVVKSLIDYMRITGDELVGLDQRLQRECRLLDTAAEKLIQVSSLDSLEIEGFYEMVQTYIIRLFDKHPIEKLYWDYMSTVQKYSAIRDVLTSQRVMNSAEPLCCICMTEVVVMAFVPCGHTFCTNCSKKTMNCHVCRQHVQNRVKLYFS
jgi:Zinc finger, C3HC4 type (RING finger)